MTLGRAMRAILQWDNEAGHTGAAMAALQVRRARLGIARCTGDLKLLNALSVLATLC